MVEKLRNDVIHTVKSAKQVAHDYGEKIPYTAIMRDMMLSQFMMNISLLHYLRKEQFLTKAERVYVESLYDTTKKFISKMMNDPLNDSIIKERKHG